MKTSQSSAALMIVLVKSLICVALFNLQAVAQTNTKIAKEVIAMTKAQWAAEMEKKPAAVSMQNVAEEYTEFNLDSPTRLDGKVLNMRLVEASSSGSDELVATEMVNEKVQVYGNVAILSYNFIGLVKDKDGEMENILAKSTRVYVKKDTKWMLVHANFAPVK